MQPVLVVSLGMAAWRMATARMPRERMFIRGGMTLFDYIASAIPGFVAAEVVVRLISTPRHRSFVTVTRVKAVVDMAREVRGAVEPGAGSEKYAANKPIGPVVTVRRAIVWGV